MTRPWFLRSGSAFADRFAAKVAGRRREVGAGVRVLPAVRVTGALLGSGTLGVAAATP